METKQLIKELEAISRKFMRDKEFYKAGRINLAIDTINEVLPQADVIKSVCICKTDKKHQEMFVGENCLYCGEKIKQTVL